jgi:hypothetical protein
MCQPSKSPFQSDVLNEFARKGYISAAVGQNRFHQHAPVIQQSHGAALARTMRRGRARSSSVQARFLLEASAAQMMQS